MDRRHHMDSGGPWIGLLLICFWASLCSGDKSSWFWARDERPRENNWQCGSIIRPNGGPQPESYRFAFGDLIVRSADLRNEIPYQKQYKKSDELECAVVIVGPSFNSRMVVRASLMTLPGRDDCRITNALTLYDLQSGRLIIRDTACGKEKMSAVMQTTKNVGLVTVDLGLVRKGSFVITVSVTDSLFGVPAQQINIPPPPMSVDPGLSNDFNISDSPILPTTPPLAANISESLNLTEAPIPGQEQNQTTEIPPVNDSQTTRPMEMINDSAGSLVNSTDINMEVDPMLPTDTEGESGSPPLTMDLSENSPPDNLDLPESDEMNAADAEENLGISMSEPIDAGKPIPSMEEYEDTAQNQPEQEPNKTTELTHEEDREPDSNLGNDYENAGPIEEPADEERPPMNGEVASFKVAKNSSMSQSESGDINSPTFAMEGYGNMAQNPIRLQEKLNDSNTETASPGGLESSGYEQMLTNNMTQSNFGHQINVSLSELDLPENLPSTTHGYGNMPITPLPPVEYEEAIHSLPEITTPNVPPQFTNAGETTSSNNLQQTDVEEHSETMEEGVSGTVTLKPTESDGSTDSQDELEADLDKRLLLRVHSSTPLPITARGLTVLAPTTESLSYKVNETSAHLQLSTLPFTTQSQDGIEGSSTMTPNLYIDAASTTIITLSETTVITPSEASMATDTTSATEKSSPSATTPLSNVDYVSTFSNMPITFTEASTLSGDFTEDMTTFFTSPVTDTTVSMTTTFPAEAITSTTTTTPSIYTTEADLISSRMAFEGAEPEEEKLKSTTIWRESTTNPHMLPSRKKTLAPPDSQTTTIREGPEVNTSGDKVSSASSTTQGEAGDFPQDQVDSSTGSSTDKTLIPEEETTPRDATAETIGIQKLENARTVPQYLTMPDAPRRDEATPQTPPQDDEFSRTTIS